MTDYENGYKEGYRKGQKEGYVKAESEHKDATQYKKGYDIGYNLGYDKGYENGQEDSDYVFGIKDALKMMKAYENSYKVINTKTLDDQMRAELLMLVYEKMTTKEVEDIFSRHQNKLYGYRIK